MVDPLAPRSSATWPADDPDFREPGALDDAAPDAMVFGRALPTGRGLNLLSRDVAASMAFAEAVLGARITHADNDFAIVRFGPSVWMVHHDRTYRSNALIGIVEGSETRGAGIELRLYGRDPDEAEAAAREREDIVLAGAMDKPHGLREAVILDPDGYAWLPGTPLKEVAEV